MSIINSYREKALLYKGEVNHAPSMTEDAHILSLETLVKDYTRGIVHNECYRQAFYDDGEDIEPVNVPEDLTDLYRALPTDLNDAPHTQASNGVKPANNAEDPDGGSAE